VLRELPQVEPSVALEQILEFKSDSPSRLSLLALRNWMIDIGRGEFTASEIEDKLEYLLANYRHFLRLHRMKTEAGALETLVVGLADIAESLAHLRFSAICG